PQRGVTSMFVDRQGMIQAHRDETLVSLANFEDGIDSKRSVFSLVAGTSDDDTLRRLMRDVTGTELLADSAFVTVNGKQMLVGIGYLDKLGWYNVTFMDIDTIIDRRLFLPIGLLLAAMMGVVAVVLVLVFKRQVLDRVSALEVVVDKARVGDYGPALSMGAGRQDEIGRLSSALTQMAGRVDDHTRLLEARVRERTRELESLAFRDGQSGILNRRGFAEAHADVATAGTSYGILLVDVDHFKQINDSHGHAAGDVVIVEVARRIQQAIGQDGVCARWGGDEFIVLLPGSGPQALRTVAHAIMRATISEPIAASARPITVSISVGACLAERGDKLEVATDMADAALYMAKQAGRGRVVVFDKDMRPDPRRHVA
ncbi:MAG: diguanylate cyclase, partial [Hyphomicrobiales bacterium]